ncbi:MAG: MFS transporter [Microbacteriaceae bacterium]|nr:MFS transporter [Microbacteriaceae bacterium]
MTDRRSLGAITFSLVGFLFLVELSSGILQGYYLPLIHELVVHLGISDAEFNWFEAAQLLLSAIAVPIFAKLGDMYGHKRMLVISTAITAAASWWLAFTGEFWSFLIAWAIQGVYSAWLPLEVALIFDRGRRTATGASQTRRAAGFLVVALEVGAIIGALSGSRVYAATGDNVMLTLFGPAIAVTLVFFAVLFGVPESEPIPGRRLDLGGVILLSLSLLFITSGLAYLRLEASPWITVGLIALGLALLIPFGRRELAHPDPFIDLRVLARPTMWPVILTAGLFGISVLGAQIPLSTYASTPRDAGYGLGLDEDVISYLIGVYLVSMIIGALLFPLLSRRASPRIALIVAASFVAVGYLLFIPLHHEVWQVLTNMVIAGIGSGALVAALPAAAAAAAPRGQTGVATGLTNTTKTIGGSFASAVFGVVLATGAVAGVGAIASYAGYVTTWVICGVTALICAIVLFFVPKLAFADVEPDEAAPSPAGDVPGDSVSAASADGE